MSTSLISLLLFVSLKLFAADTPSISIDFKKCEIGKVKINVAFGSSTYDITGLSGKDCVMNWGGEVENPNWDRKLPNNCKVPSSLGKVDFKKTDMGVDFSPISKYCSK